MTHITTSRVSPEAEASEATIKPSGLFQSTEEEDGVIKIISNGRIQCPYPAAAKAWVSDAVPPSSSDELSAPATAVHYYRQRQRFGDGESSALTAWLATVLCMPRLGSGRPRSPTSRMDSVDSVDFVSTWQKAQAEAAARRVVPALKRASEVTPPLPTTPESLTRAETPSLGPTRLSNPGSTELPGSESKSGHISFVGPPQRPSNSQVALSTCSSADLLKDDSDSLQPLAPISRPVSRPDSHQSAKRSVRFN